MVVTKATTKLQETKQYVQVRTWRCSSETRLVSSQQVQLLRRAVRQPRRGELEIPGDHVTSCVRPKERKTTQTKACIHMFMSALVTKAKRRTQPKCPQTNGRIDTGVHICTMESCAAMNRHEAQIPAAPSSKTSCDVRSHMNIVYVKGATQTSCYIRGASHTNIMYVKGATQTSCV